jgi:hypothetical protein
MCFLRSDNQNIIWRSAPYKGLKWYHQNVDLCVQTVNCSDDDTFHVVLPWATPFQNMYLLSAEQWKKKNWENRFLHAEKTRSHHADTVTTVQWNGGDTVLTGHSGIHIIISFALNSNKKILKNQLGVLLLKEIVALKGLMYTRAMNVSTPHAKHEAWRTCTLQLSVQKVLCPHNLKNETWK